MQYGICCGPEVAVAAKNAGYDFFEWTVGEFLKPTENHTAFSEAFEAVSTAELPCPVVNCFLSGDMKITGPEVNRPALEKYTDTAFQRAGEAGVKLIVFGSGGARRIPDGYDRRAAWQQLIEFCCMLAPMASKHEVEVVVEPLNLQECNVLTTVGECARLVREVNHPAIRLLVDTYHFMKDDDSLEDIVANADIIRHVHIATKSNRMYPGAEPCDFAPIFKALAHTGYEGGVSIEATKTQDANRDIPLGIATMKTMATEAGR